MSRFWSEYLLIITMECTRFGVLKLYSLHIGVPRSARVGPGAPSFDCVGSGISNSDWITSGIPDSDPMLSEYPNPGPKVSEFWTWISGFRKYPFRRECNTGAGGRDATWPCLTASRLAHFSKGPGCTSTRNDDHAHMLLIVCFFAALSLKTRLWFCFAPLAPCFWRQGNYCTVP